jgi:hypothetical protein
MSGGRASDGDLIQLSRTLLCFSDLQCDIPANGAEASHRVATIDQPEPRLSCKQTKSPTNDPHNREVSDRNMKRLPDTNCGLDRVGGPLRMSTTGAVGE